MAGFAQGSVELKHKTSGTNSNKDHLRLYARDDEYLFTVDNEGNERSLQYYHSTGVSDPFLSDLVDNGNGTANISGCNVRLYKTNDFTGDIYEYYVSGVTLSFIDGTEQYVVADYNNGNPILRVENNKLNVNESNVVCLFCCWRQGNEIHSIGSDSKANGLSNKISLSITDTIPYRKSVDGGLMISELTSPNPRTILITSAVVYGGVIPHNIFQFNSSIDRLTLAYHSGGNWLYTDNLVYNNTQYDDGTNLITIPNNKYAVRWFYRSIGDIKQTFYVLGNNYYNSVSDARLETIRNDLPIVLRKHCILVGRSIIQYNATNGIVENVQDINFAITSIQNHNDLNNIQGGGLGEYYHVSATTFGYLSAVSADIQQQLNTKISSAASPSNHNNLIGLQGGSSGNYYHVSATTFGYLSAVSADIQQQLNSKISSAAAPTNHNNLIGLQGGSSGNYYHISATTFGYLSAVSADIQSQINSKISSEIFNILQEPTGFTSRTNTKLLFNDSTRTFTISALSGNFDIYYRGNKFVKTTDSIVISNTSGIHFIYYSSAGILSELVNTPWDITTTIQVAAIYWTGTSSLGIGEERHGTVMDCATHSYLHTTFGTRYANGFSSTYTLNNDTSAFFGLTNGRIEDEDIFADIVNGTSGTYLSQQINYPGFFPVYYRQGNDGIGTWRKDAATNLPYKNNSIGSYVNYNQLSGSTWVQTPASNNNFVAYFIYATTEIFQPIISVQGQRFDTTLIDAQNNNVPSNLNFNDFPIIEAKLLYRIILKTNASYTGNTFRVQIVDVSDYRNQLVSTGSVIGGTGTVTYVGLSGNPIFSISGSPITNAGIFTIDLSSQNSGTFLSGPSATSGIPTFRRITSADIPVHNQDFSTIKNRTETINAINQRIDTGFYQNSTPLTTSGWPTSGSWWHLLNLSHSNSANYYSLQIAADYYSQDFRIRSTNNNGLQSWSTIYTSTNLPSILSNYLPLLTLSGTQDFNNLNSKLPGNYIVSASSYTNGPIGAAPGFSYNVYQGYFTNGLLTQLVFDGYNGGLIYRWEITSGNWSSWRSPYDQITLPSMLGNYLPLSGGALTGQLRGTTISALSNISAANFATNGSYIFRNSSSAFFSIGADSSSIYIRNLSANGSVIDYPFVIYKDGKVQLGYSGSVRPIEMGGPVTIATLNQNGFVRTNSSGLLTTSALTSGDIPQLRYLPLSGGTVLSSVNFNQNIYVSQNISGNSFVKHGGVSTQFLKADGSIDSNSYALNSSLNNYLPLSGGTLTGQLKGTSISASGNVSAFNAYLNSIILSQSDLTTYPIGSTSPSKRLYQTIAENDYWSIYGEGTSNNGSMILEVGDDTSENIKFRFKNTNSPYTTYTPYEFNYNQFNLSSTRQRIYYDDLIDSNSDYSQNCLEIATNTSSPSHSFKPGIGFHSRGQYASLLYLNAQQDWKAKDDSGTIVTFYHTGNLPSVLGNYLPLSGGTMTGDISFTNSTTGIGKGIYGTNGDNDHWRIVGGSTGSNQGYLEIATDDDSSEPIYIRQYQGTFSSPVSARTLTLLDSNGNTNFPGNISANNIINRGSYYVSNYAAGGNPSLITNQGVATFYTLNLDYYNTGERSLKFADSAYLGPTFATFFNNGSSQNNAIVVKGAGNNDYAGIYFGVAGVNPRYIGTRGDNTLYIAGSSIKTTGELTQTGTSTFVGNTNIGRVAWPNEYTITIHDKFNVSGTTLLSNLNVDGLSEFHNNIDVDGISYFNNNIDQDDGTVYFGTVNNAHDFRVRHSSYFFGDVNFSTGSVAFNTNPQFNSSATFSALTKFNVGQVLEPTWVNSPSYTATDTAPGFLVFSNISTTATKITLSDSTRDGKCIIIFNFSGESRTIESNVTEGLQISPGVTASSKIINNGSLYMCIKLSSGTYTGGWKVREL